MADELTKVSLPDKKSKGCENSLLRLQIVSLFQNKWQACWNEQTSNQLVVRCYPTKTENVNESLAGVTV